MQFVFLYARQQEREQEAGGAWSRETLVGWSRQKAVGKEKWGHEEVDKGGIGGYEEGQSRKSGPL